jgi:hypothetical protein
VFPHQGAAEHDGYYRCVQSATLRPNQPALWRLGRDAATWRRQRAVS